jgi:hypothetical protein
VNLCKSFNNRKTAVYCVMFLREQTDKNLHIYIYNWTSATRSKLLSFNYNKRLTTAAAAAIAATTTTTTPTTTTNYLPGSSITCFLETENASSFDEFTKREKFRLFHCSNTVMFTDAAESFMNCVTKKRATMKKGL